ncbi:MAG: putative sensor domain DACNV-containing protein [Terriglobia bacterium]
MAIPGMEIPEIQPAYPAARAAALKVHPHFARHGAPYGPVPDVEAMEAIIDAAFWASLRREENITPRISLAFVSEAQLNLSMIFARPVALASQALTRLGPAVERPGIHLCVSRHDGELMVWGAARKLPPLCFVLEVVAPGLLVLKHSRGDESGKFVNLAVLQGDEIKIVDHESATASDWPELLTPLLGLQPRSEPDPVSVLIQLAISMRAHGRGGVLLVVPAESTLWLKSILQPITYQIEPAFRALADLMLEDVFARTARRWQDSLAAMVDGIAGLTAVDGATILTDRYDLLAFGAKIVLRPGREQVSGVMVSEPIEGGVVTTTEPGNLGGTRHLSAAQFVHDQRDALAFVASQDGRFTVFAWSQPCKIVRAYRIETLLL